MNEAHASVPPAVGVLGGGRMGTGIAHAFLAAGAHVTVVDINDAALAAARGRIEKAIQGSLDRGAEGTFATWASRLTLSTDTADFAATPLVVEAVPESLELKNSAFASIAAAAPAAVIATNTSSLSVSDLAQCVDNDVIGLHFFNPVPSSLLVEVVVAQSTPPELVDKAKQWVAALGKTAVVVRDSPGFASSRLGVAIALEAIRMVEEGVASPRDIDNAMVLGYKFPIGPLELTDIVGLDVRLGIAEYLESQLGERFSPPQLLRDKVARGELGRKSGAGFYDYS
ncbi:3-hydroxyacyl-CoA dehydrogenase family protein [Corynebacterium flavescens]|uniref:3-hydroxyacyl-CoA dehydrogenase n=1 Tax=Corynebacterium flavescens TaxID=28028 RepID=A0A1L7CPT7_CORFL|nr:3-hydroxyacyl-CoA dehydrogenase family protein [Corynebacterium flavescens]APT87876.1 3-hydroxybutyryl-CoA dehydrogenase [Corynebacterium flavescens]KAA8719701.1 3-hydroxyacyl-CoA dehydrogenase family protein [Corynebacterium flavescens]MDN6198993.1 3-hydroxyacyl-CoA dehydrogenase family protein [Corynebacterium flavescens]MDN6225588.1 3-hydroxyacyl-CoA dehydrogenase family protein [Corynebacterium flavescens]GEB97879.1 3-hydroxyacyl-CoA dehydrogenase [Corynebacterium flavescens]